MAVTSDGAGALRPTILVVEDDGAVRNLIQTTLDAGGFAHVSESTGRGAIAAAAMSMPDVVLLDLGLPDIDGIEVVLAIRAWSQMPIIVVSARSEDADKIGALDAGADDYLTKPFSVGELLARIRTTVRRLSYQTEATASKSSVFENGELTIPGLSDEDGAELFGAGGYTKILIENAICNSDNDSFAMLRSMYDANGYNEWVDELGIQDAAYTPDSWFPWYSVRSSLKIWTEMYNYWQTGGDAAQWLSSLCGETTVSFLRDVVDPLGATVRNKAGWCSGSDYGYDFNGVCDVGVIQLDGRTYVVSVMAGVPDCEENRELVENLIAAIFDARDALR